MQHNFRTSLYVKFVSASEEWMLSTWRHWPRRTRRAKNPPNEVVEACNIRIIPHTTILPPLKNEDPKCKYHGEMIEGCCFTKVFSDAQLLGNVDRRKFPDEESHIECQRDQVVMLQSICEYNHDHVVQETSSYLTSNRKAHNATTMFISYSIRCMRSWQYLA